MKPWYESRPERLAIEARLLKRECPGATLVRKGGMLRVQFTVRGRTYYSCELIYPNRFPYAHMQAYIRNPEIKSRWHQYASGMLCLHHGEDVGPETTIVVYLKWVRDWIKRYEEAKASGEWRD